MDAGARLVALADGHDRVARDHKRTADRLAASGDLEAARRERDASLAHVYLAWQYRKRCGARAATPR